MSLESGLFFECYKWGWVGYNGVSEMKETEMAASLLLACDTDSDFRLKTEETGEME